MTLDVAKIVVGRDLVQIVVLACLGSSVLGAALITPLMGSVYQKIQSKSQDKAHRYAIIVGMIERPFYTLSVCFGAYMMVGGWLVLKAFSNIDAEKRDVTTFHAYLLGNILSVFVGTASGFISMFLIKIKAYL